MTNVFSIVADQHQVVISMNNIWFTGALLIFAAFIVYKIWGKEDKK